ncbi:tyrosine-type recombinase/integrase [Natrialbaceae archaeon GCM10025810]
MPRYSREDVLTERELVLLLEGARKLSPPKDFEARLTLFAAGVLGMRAGEIAHFDTDWIHWPDRMVKIPEYDRCTKGQDGGICGYCRSRVEDYLETHPDTPLEEAIEMRWEPKTPNSVRSIPFDFDVRLELCIEEFDRRYDGYPKSRATVNRRIEEAAQQAGMNGRIYPHSLRATAATIHASRGVSPYALMSVMGWVDMETARTYIRASDESAARELRSKHR